MDTVANSIVKWNPFREGYFLNPYPHLRACRETNPIQQGYNGEWILFKYDHVKEILRSPDFLTTDLSGFFREKEPIIFKNTSQCPYLSRGTSHWLPHLNDSVHETARGLMESVLGRLDMKKIVNNCINELFDKYFTDNPLDATVIGAALPGLLFNTLYGGRWNTKEGITVLQRIAHSLALSQDIFVPIKTYQLVNEDMKSFFETVLQDFELNRENYPLLAHMQEENEKQGLGFSFDDMTTMIGILLLGAIETSTTTISSITYELMKDRSLIQYILNADDILINILSEEFFRFIAPLQYTIRINKTAFELEGKNIPQNSKLVLCLAAANRDPSIFTDPDRIVLDRKNNPHLSFGSGVHTCLGSKLARTEIRALLKPLASALINYELAPNASPQWHRTILIRGFKELKLVRRT